MPRVLACFSSIVLACLRAACVHVRLCVACSGVRDAASAFNALMLRGFCQLECSGSLLTNTRALLARAAIQRQRSTPGAGDSKAASAQARREGKRYRSPRPAAGDPAPDLSEAPRYGIMAHFHSTLPQNYAGDYFSNFSQTTPLSNEYAHFLRPWIGGNGLW